MVSSRLSAGVKYNKYILKLEFNIPKHLLGQALKDLFFPHLPECGCFVWGGGLLPYFKHKPLLMMLD